VLTVTATAPTISAARLLAYEAIGGLKSQFPAGTPLAYRSDIARGISSEESDPRGV
jgi:phosphoribosylamine-glycine ligase